MSGVRMAVIGAGHLGTIHARLLKSLPDVELVGVADVAAEACRRLADELQTRAALDYRELIDQIDAAIIATPTTLHRAVAVELLEAGKHLLVEKPLAPTVAEADEIIAAAESRGRVLQVGHVERFNPALRAVLPHVREPRYIEALRMGGFTFRSTDIGCVLDLMIHDLDLVLALVPQPVVDVQALGLSVMGGHEDLATARLAFADGCVAQLRACRISPQAERSMHLFAADLCASVDFATRRASLIRPCQALRSGSLDVDRLTPAEKSFYRENLFRELLPTEELAVEPRNAILDQQQQLVEAITTGRPVDVDGRQARAALVVAERILAAIHDREPQAPRHAPPAPHFHPAAAREASHRRRAG